MFNKPFLTTYRIVRGELANFAVRRSPYTVPSNLAPALREFDTVFKSSVTEHIEDSGIFVTSYQQLVADVIACLNVCPLIVAWSIPDPNGDFVDLSTLAINVAESIASNNLVLPA